jgi:hypothetical protein
VDAVVSRRAPVVTGEAGRRALEVAEQITDKIRTGNVTTKDTKDEITKDTKKINPSCFVFFVSCFSRFRISWPDAKLADMYSDLNDFIADLDKRKLLARAPKRSAPISRSPP